MPFCKDPHCGVLHCWSSRCIWNHYKECQDPSCETCRPTREADRRYLEQRQQQQGISRRPNSFDPHRIPDDREDKDLRCEIIGRSAERERQQQLIVPSLSTQIEAETSSAEEDLEEDDDEEDSDPEDDEEEFEEQGMDSNEMEEQAAAAANKRVVRVGERMGPPRNKRKRGDGGGRSQKHRRR